MVLAGLGTWPQSGSAQAGKKGTTSEPNLQEPSSEPAPEEPAFQLELTPEDVEVVPSPPRTVDGYTLKEMEQRAQRAKIWLGISVIPVVVGVGILVPVGLYGNDCLISRPTPEMCDRFLNSGMVLGAGGAAAMIATGILLGVRKGKLRRLREAAYHEGPRRVQWDPATSRIVF
jgi:hypothetical protein